MVDQVVARMIAKRAELQAKLKHLAEEVEQTKAKIAQIEQSLSTCQEYSDEVISDFEGITVPLIAVSQNCSSGTGVRVRGIAQVDFVPLLRPILLKHGRPMEFEGVLAAIKNTGRQIGGNPEESNLKTKLGRAKKDIKYISGAGYWPIDVPCPEVSYMPL